MVADAKLTPLLAGYVEWLRAQGHAATADECAAMGQLSPLGLEQVLDGPVGETNVYLLHPRGRVGAIAETETGALIQIGAILATGNIAVVEAGSIFGKVPAALRTALGGHLDVVPNLDAEKDLRAVLFEGARDKLMAFNQRIAARPGAIIVVQARTAEELAGGKSYNLPLLLEERSVSTNTAAAGGNASLMSIG